MAERNFMELLQARWLEGKFVCVGLDSDWEKIPDWFKQATGRDPLWTTVRFNEKIIEATRDLVCCYKPNSAFYEAHGDIGFQALQQTIRMINDEAPEVPVIYDGKRGDIDNTNLGYIEAAFDYLNADAITVHPYLGAESLKSLLDRKDKNIFVLCRTSNKGADEFQDLPVATGWTPAGSMPLYQYVAMMVAKDWNKNGNCGVVAGATYPTELDRIRRVVGDMPILIPGVGKQGGDVEAVVRVGKDSRGQGMIINSSSGIIFASPGEDFAEAARQKTSELHSLITQCLKGETSGSTSEITTG